MMGCFGHFGFPGIGMQIGNPVLSLAAVFAQNPSRLKRACLKLEVAGPKASAQKWTRSASSCAGAYIL